MKGEFICCLFFTMQLEVSLFVASLFLMQGNVLFLFVDFSLSMQWEANLFSMLGKVHLFVAYFSMQ